MKQGVVTIISRRNWFLVILLGLTGQIAWNVNNVWFNTFMYDNITPNPGAIAWLVGVSAVVATTTTFVMGTTSDRLGKRKPFIIIGYILWGLTIIAFPLTAYFGVTIIAVVAAVTAAAVMTFFGSTANDATFNAWTTDISDETNRGVLSSVINVLPLLALIVGFGLSGLLIDRFGYYIFFYSLGLLVSITGFISNFLLRDSDKLQKKNRDETGSFFSQLFTVFHPETVRSNRRLFLLFTSLGLFSVSAQIFLPYQIIYMNNYLGLSLTEAGIASAIPVLIAVIIAVPVGRLTDRGHGPELSLAAPLLLSAGLWFVSFVTHLYLIVLALILGISAFIMMLIVMIAGIKNLMPPDNRGQFEGIRMIFMVGIPMIIGPVIGSYIISNYGIPTVLNGEPGFIPTPVLFRVSGTAVLLSLIPLLLLRRGQKTTAHYRGGA